MTELDAWLALTRRLPPLPRMLGVANKLVRPIYLRRHRDRVRTVADGFLLDLDPHELVDGLLLFAPHLYDRRERAFLARHLRPGDTFVDGGAYLGFYSLVAAHRVGPNGHVVAVEPDPDTAARLRQHLVDNGVTWATVVEAALSDRVGSAFLGAPAPGNAGHRALSPVGHPVRTIDVATLLDGVDRIDGIKLDLEGHEAPVLRQLLAAHRPRVLVVEDRLDRPEGGVATRLLEEAGYRVRRASRDNVVAARIT